jgi:hypothetical protein
MKTESARIFDGILIKSEEVGKERNLRPEHCLQFERHWQTEFPHDCKIYFCKRYRNEVKQFMWSFGFKQSTEIVHILFLFSFALFPCCSVTLVLCYPSSFQLLYFKLQNFEFTNVVKENVDPLHSNNMQLSDHFELILKVNSWELFHVDSANVNKTSFHLGLWATITFVQQRF